MSDTEAQWDFALRNRHIHDIRLIYALGLPLGRSNGASTDGPAMLLGFIDPQGYFEMHRRSTLPARQLCLLQNGCGF